MDRVRTLIKRKFKWKRRFLCFTAYNSKTIRIFAVLLEKTRCKIALQNVEGKKRGNKLWKRMQMKKLWCYSTVLNAIKQWETELCARLWMANFKNCSQSRLPCKITPLNKMNEGGKPKSFSPSSFISRLWCLFQKASKPILPVWNAVVRRGYQ